LGESRGSLPSFGPKCPEFGIGSAIFKERSWALSGGKFEQTLCVVFLCAPPRGECGENSLTAWLKSHAQTNDRIKMYIAPSCQKFAKRTQIFKMIARPILNFDLAPNLVAHARTLSGSAKT
jgi:hypothetical protein